MNHDLPVHTVCVIQLYTWPKQCARRISYSEDFCYRTLILRSDHLTFRAIIWTAHRTAAAPILHAYGSTLHYSVVISVEEIDWCAFQHYEPKDSWNPRTPRQPDGSAWVWLQTWNLVRTLLCNFWLVCHNIDYIRAFLGFWGSIVTFNHPANCSVDCWRAHRKKPTNPRIARGIKLWEKKGCTVIIWQC